MGDIFSGFTALASTAVGMFSAFQSSEAAERQADMYNQQAALNRGVGAFNVLTAQRNGVESVKGVALQTKRLLGEQMVSFSNRGISMEGSPMYVLGDTLTMGAQHAQEQYFNAEVQKINYEYAAEGASATAMANAENARYKAMSSTLDIFRTFVDGAKTMGSVLYPGTQPAEGKQPKGRQTT
jgi:hypothetical protein